MRIIPSLLVILALVCALCTSVASLEAKKLPTIPDLSDQVVDLPGAPANLPFRLFAGYLTVNTTSNRQLFYYYAESQNNPSTDPLIIWLQGGPGCSSLLGAFIENGPLIIQKDAKTLALNPSAWNLVANVLYLESPAGVGFSFSGNSNDYNVGDKRTAADTVAFLQQFYQKYPYVQNVPFWITGESYAGHYVPNLAIAVHEYNQAGNTPSIPLKGFQVGNPWTDAVQDNIGAVTTWYTHHFLPEDLYNNILLYCDFSHIGPLKEKQQKLSKIASPNPVLCTQYTNAASTLMAGLNIYQIYQDICLQTEETAASRLISLLEKAQGPHALWRFNALKQQSQNATGLKDAIHGDPCIDSHFAQYINVPEVQVAMNAIPSVANPITWSGCSPVVNYSYSDLLSSMIPKYDYIFSNMNISVLVYSGDVDGIVPTAGTRGWLTELSVTPSGAWTPWIISTNSPQKGQLGGYYQVYGNNAMIFATVRGAGHLVPNTQPERSFQLFTNFLSGLTPSGTPYVQDQNHEDL